MAINNDLIVRASQAKRMRNLFRSKHAQGVTIPVVCGGRTVEVSAEDIARTFDNVMNENLVDFAAGLTAEEVISQAYRIENLKYDRLPSDSKMGRALKKLEGLAEVE